MKDLMGRLLDKRNGPPVPFASDRELTLVKSRSLAWLHWGTLALFLLAYLSIPFVWEKVGMVLLITPLTAAGFYVSWTRVGKRRTDREVRLLTGMTVVLIVVALFVNVEVLDSISIMGADLVAAVCAGFSFSLKRAKDYFYIIAASAAILVVGLLSRNSLSVVPVLLYLLLLIPVVQQGRKEQHQRTIKGSSYSLEEQGDRTPFIAGLLLPAMILVLATSLLYLVVPKPLHEPNDVFREVATRRGEGQTDGGGTLQDGTGTGEGTGGEGTGGTGTGQGEGQTDQSTEGFESGRQPPVEKPPSSFSEKDERQASNTILFFLLAILALLLLFLGGWALWAWWKKRRARKRRAREEVARGASLTRDQLRYIFLTYKKMCEELATVGLSRRKSDTPDEYLARIRSTHPSATQFAAPISNALEDCLYGMHPIDRESLSKLDACLQYLRELCQGIRSSKGEAWE